MLSGPRELAAKNYEKDGAMAANGGSRIERSSKRSARFLEEANGSMGSDLWMFEKTKGILMCGEVRR